VSARVEAEMAGWRRARARAAALQRWRPEAAEEIAELNRDVRAGVLAERIREAVAQEPPLTRRQVATLRRLLGTGG
jgi:hypothetical protein